MSVNLADLGPLTETVKVRGKDYEVRAITVSDIIWFLGKFPDFATLLGPKAATLSARQMITALAPRTLGVLIATALGKNKDDADMWSAENLSASETLKFVGAIFRLTFPDGVGPFVEELGALTESLKPPQNGTESDGQSSTHISAAVITDIPPLTPEAIRRARLRPSQRQSSAGAQAK